ncbi:MAG: metal ABC transporter solute-binding protein, Zn/Mn family [Desulfurivibrio sp.]
MTQRLHYTRLFLLLLFTVGFWLGPVDRTEAAADDHLPAKEVTVGIAPLAYLVKRIGGERVNVATLIPPGQDPHSFEPRPGQISGLSRSDLYFSLDMPFERTLLTRIPADTGPRLIAVDRGIAKLAMAEHHHGHAAGDSEAASHAHGEPDPHIWLGPRQLLIISAHIVTGLAELDPPHAATYLENYEQLKSEIEELHDRLSQLLAPLAGRTFYVYHPAFGYFADSYGLRQHAVETGGKTPTPRQLINLIQQANHDGVRVIFVQPQFDRKSAAAVARAINGVVVPLDPLAADILANLAGMAARIHEALGDEKGPQSGGNRQP